MTVLTQTLDPYDRGMGMVKGGPGGGECFMLMEWKFLLPLCVLQVWMVMCRCGYVRRMCQTDLEGGRDRVGLLGFWEGLGRGWGFFDLLEVEILRFPLVWFASCLLSFFVKEK